MLHDWKTFGNEIATLLRKGGDSGDSGDKAKNHKADNGLRVPTPCTEVSPLRNEWRQACAGSGDRKTKGIESVERCVPSVPTVSTKFGEGRAASLIEGDPQEWYAILAGLKERESPDWMSPDRWEMLLADAEHFLVRWSQTADAMGWTELDLYGAHPTRPATRFDLMGLLVLLQGAEVIALSAESASFRRPSGAGLRFYRPAAGGVLLSEATSDDY